LSDQQSVWVFFNYYYFFKKKLKKKTHTDCQSVWVIFVFKKWDFNPFTCVDRCSNKKTKYPKQLPYNFRLLMSHMDHQSVFIKNDERYSNPFTCINRCPNKNTMC